MKNHLLLISIASLALAPTGLAAPASQSTLEEGWKQPPLSARTRAYWWWLNGNVTKAAITRDLEEMKAKGWGGASSSMPVARSRVATTAWPTAPLSLRPNGASFTGTPCAKPTGSAWK